VSWYQDHINYLRGGGEVNNVCAYFLDIFHRGLERALPLRYSVDKTSPRVLLIHRSSDAVNVLRSI